MIVIVVGPIQAYSQLSEKPMVKMTDENMKCPTKNSRLVGQNVQRSAKSFREACILIDKPRL